MMNMNINVKKDEQFENRRGMIQSGRFLQLI